MSVSEQFLTVCVTLLWEEIIYVTKPEHFSLLDEFTSPSCSSSASKGCLRCSDSSWNSNGGYFDCYAKELDIFGDETFLNAKMEVLKLETEELIQIIEITGVYDYCIESEEFTLTVFDPSER